jgi:hypothetical protein
MPSYSTATTQGSSAAMTHLIEDPRVQPATQAPHVLGRDRRPGPRHARGATFGAGMIGMQTAYKTIGTPIANRVDDRADTRARRALRVASGPRRRRLRLATGDHSGPIWPIILFARSPQVLARCEVTILKARPLTRHYLFDVKTLARSLAELRRSRASGWVVPETRVEVRMQRHGLGCLYDDHALAAARSHR